MSRTLALAAALALALTPAAVRAEPLDIRLQDLGAPSASVWTTIDTRFGLGLSAADEAALASDAKTRFAILSVETGLALSSAILQPASTNGVAGWDVGFEGTYAPIHDDVVGQTSAGADFSPRSPWQTKGKAPGALMLASFHVRKALPFSVEVGGRAIYMSQSNYYAGQAEAKIALVEGYKKWPDVALRASYTTMVGHPTWNLGTTELDAMVSKRLSMGISGVTPYLAVRWCMVNASSEKIDFAPEIPATTPANMSLSQAAFPRLDASLLRYTLGARFSTAAMALGVELTYLPSKSLSGKQDPTADQYPTVKIASSFGGSFRLGWDF